MYLDAKELFFAPFGQTQNVSIELFNEKFEDEVLAKRIKGELKLTKLENEILAKFKGTARVKIACDRCLAEFEVELPLNFSQVYLQEKPEEEEKMRIEKGFKIELSEPLRQEILIRLPIKKLCREDCAGLCPKCGVNLNSEKCKCKSKIKFQLSTKIESRNSK